MGDGEGDGEGKVRLGGERRQRRTRRRTLSFRLVSAPAASSSFSTSVDPKRHASMSGVSPRCSRSAARGARREAASDASPASEGAHGASDKHTERPSGASGRAAPHTCVRGRLKPQPHTHTYTHATRPKAYFVLVVEVGLPLDEQLGDGGLVVASCVAQRSVATLLVRRRIDGAHAERGRRGRARRLRARASDASGRTTPAATRWRRLARERAPTASRRRRAARRATRACVAAAGAAAEAPPTPPPRVHERGATTHTRGATRRRAGGVHFWWTRCWRPRRAASAPRPPCRSQPP